LKNQNVTLVSFSPLCWSRQSLILILTNGVTLQKCNCRVFSNAGIMCSYCVYCVLKRLPLFVFVCSHSDSPHSEPGTIDEADNCTEPHTSDDGTGIFFFSFIALYTLLLLSLMEGCCIQFYCI